MSLTLNIAHRGFTKDAPDNTLESFYAAIKLGADGIECDVHETADHRFVIFHNDKAEGKTIGKSTLEEIRNIKLAGQYRIPTLEETLDLCHNRVKLMLELKRVNSLDLFLKIVNAAIQPEELFITSFRSNLVRELAEFTLQTQRGILIRWLIINPLRTIEVNKVGIMLPRFSYVNSRLVNTLHSHGFSIMVWDCNDLQNLRTALEWDVDGIITDSPDILALELKNRKDHQK